MAISAELIAYCKLGNSIIGCWEPPPLGYDNEPDDTDDTDWAHAITVRLREMVLADVLAEVKRNVDDDKMRVQLYDEIIQIKSTLGNTLGTSRDTC